MFSAPAEAPDAAFTAANPAALASASAPGAAPCFVWRAKGTHCPVPKRNKALWESKPCNYWCRRPIIPANYSLAPRAEKRNNDQKKQ